MRAMAARRFVALVACAPALALAACGSGSSSSATLTRAQYDAKVNRLCLVTADQQRELHIDNTVADWSSHLGASTVEIDKRFDSRLAQWKPPSSIAGAAAAFRAASRKVLADDKAAVSAAKAGDKTKLRAAIQQANADVLATFPAARKIGATGCYVP